MDLEKIKSKEWRLANLYSIVDKRSQRVRFAMNSIQAKIALESYHRQMILKARQFGVSTLGLIDIFDTTIWTPNQTSCILAHEKDALEKLFRIVTRAHAFMDERIRPELARGGGSKHELFFPAINSRIYCDLESRSDTIHNLHVSEAAFMADQDRLKATLQAVPLGGRVRIETTPNGIGNHFYDEWTDPNSTYKRMFFPWYLHHEYQIPTKPLERTKDEKKLASYAKKEFGITITDAQIAFRRFKMNEIKGMFIQEYPEDPDSCFLSSGASACDLVKIAAMQKDAQAPIRETDTVKIYKERERNGHYVIGADAAEGVGGDFSSGTVMNARTLEQVATLRGDFKPADFAHELVELAKQFATGEKMPIIAVERNNHGHTVIHELENGIGYSNIYRNGDGVNEGDGRLGWLTDRVSRPIMIDAYIEGAENRTIRLHDKTSIQELLTLVKANGKIEASEGKHDDTVIAGAIALQVCIKEGVASVYDNIGDRIRV